LANQRVLVTSWIVPEDDPSLEVLRAAGIEIVMARRQAAHTEDEMVELLKGISGVVAGSDRYSEKVFASTRELKVISRVGVGYDAIDVKAATEHGVAITTTPGTNQDAVADHALALILAVARRIVDFDRFMRAGDWNRPTPADVYRQTLGILGLGRIGKGVARRGRGFDMRVIAYDPFWDDEFARANQVERVGLDDVFRQADFISLHLPSSAETLRIVNAERLALMKPTAYLINTARGTLIDEDALYDALVSNRIAGAGLDVFDREPPWGSKLLGLPNVTLSPHVAGFSPNANAAMNKMATENTLMVLRGQRPHFCVNPEVLG